MGELSRRTGCHIETIRYYEKQGLLPAPPRTMGGHRAFGDEHLRRLTFIVRAKGLAFGMREIRALLSLVDEHDYTCHDIRELTLVHIQDIGEKIRDLRRLEKALNEIVSKCSDDAVPECPIVDALYGFE